MKNLRNMALLGVILLLSGCTKTGDDDVRDFLRGKVTPDKSAPSTPGNFYVAAGSTVTSLDLSWVASSDNSTSGTNMAYQICRSTSASGCSTFNATHTVIGVLTLTITGLSTGITYYFMIRAVDENGNFSASSGQISAIPGTLSAPIFSPGAGTYGASQFVTLSASTVGSLICYTTNGSTPAAATPGTCSLGTQVTIGSGINIAASATLKALATKTAFTNSNVATGAYIIDTAAPTVGTAISFNIVTQTGLTVNWGAASDNVTPTASLEYKLVKDNTASANINSIALADAKTGGDLLMDWTANTTSKAVGGLNAMTTYYFAVLVRDALGNKTLYVPASQGTFVTTATRVYGQAGSFLNIMSNNPSRSANSLFSPSGMAVDSGGVYVADRSNQRVLYYAGTSTTAARVYGQGGSFTAGTINNGGLSADSLQSPTAVAVDSSGVYVADQNNCRVLYYSGTSTTATRVYGQAGSFSTGIMNNGGVSADSLRDPEAVAVDSGGVYIADRSNHRVLYYSGTSTTATRVYGQAGSFATSLANNGGISANSLFSPSGIAVDGSGVYIAEYNNNRVLYYSGTSTTATRVYGQAGSFSTGTANNGGISASSLLNPYGIAVGHGGVYVADYNNYRVLYYSGTSTTATRVYGQAGSFTTGTINNGGISADSLSPPFGIAVDNTGVYVGDLGNHRVLFY